MSNPWLQIPASDYEGHMDDPDVDQLSFLSRMFKEALDDHQPASIALLGCATGNGLEVINPKITTRVTAIDINPEYLKILHQRYSKAIPRLQTIEGDLETLDLIDRDYALIFAGLVFEYVDPQIILSKIADWLAPDGCLVSILQLPAIASGKVSKTEFQSLNLLDPFMELVTPDDFRMMAGSTGLMEVRSETVVLKSGKPFYIGTYKLE